MKKLLTAAGTAALALTLLSGCGSPGTSQPGPSSPATATATAAAPASTAQARAAHRAAVRARRAAHRAAVRAAARKARARARRRARRATSSPAPGPAACTPTTPGDNCYEPGEFCSAADHGMTGISGSGEAIRCEDSNGWRWEPA